MPMNNVDTFIDKLDALEGQTRGAVMASVAWAYTAGLVNITTGLIEDANPDPERVERMERRQGELAQAVTWAAGLAAADYRPEAHDVVARFSTPQTVSTHVDDERLKLVAEEIGMDVETMRTVHSQDVAQRQEQARQRAQTVRDNAERIRRAVDHALGSDVHADFELSGIDELRFWQKASEKLEARRLQQATYALTARVGSRALEALSECKLLRPLVEEANERMRQVEQALEEARAAEAAQDARVIA